MYFYNSPSYQKMIARSERIRPEHQTVINTLATDHRFADEETRKTLRSMSTHMNRDRSKSIGLVGKKNEAKFSPSVISLLDWARNKGLISDYFASDVFKKREGSFNPKTKRMLLSSAGDIATNDSNAIHELVPALHSNPQMSRAQRLYDKAVEYRHRFGEDADIVLPKNWAEGAMGNPLLSRFKESLDVPSGTDKISQYSTRAYKRRAHRLKENIPSAESWSGVTTKGTTSIANPEEVQAYYLSEPENILKTVRKEERARELGAFLLDFGVPDDLVRDIVRDAQKY